MMLTIGLPLPGAYWKMGLAERKPKGGSAGLLAPADEEGLQHAADTLASILPDGLAIKSKILDRLTHREINATWDAVAFDQTCTSIRDAWGSN